MLAYFMKKNSAEQKLQNSAYALIIGGALAIWWTVRITVLWWISWIFIGIFIIIRYSMWQILQFCIGAGLLALDAFKGDKKSGQK